MIKSLLKPEINVEKLHTTEMGQMRITRNLGLEVKDVILWCRQAVIAADNDAIVRRGKNWYVYGDTFVLTVNAKSHTVITAHKLAEKG